MTLLSRISLYVTLLAVALPIQSEAQLRFEEDFNYNSGELNTVSFDFWRIRTGSPWAEVNNGSLLINTIGDRTFNGAYQALWPLPASLGSVFISFQLTVEVAPTDIDGSNIAAIGNTTGEFNRSHLFLKAGRQPNHFRLGVSTSSVNVDTAVFFPADLLVNETYTVIIAWDNVNLVSRLYIDAPDDAAAYRVRVDGGTARSDGFRRVAVVTSTNRNLGRYRIDTIRVSEDFAGAWQSFTAKPEPIIDGDDGLLLAEDFSYPAGELNEVSRGQWRRSPSTSNPFAVVQNGRLVFGTQPPGDFLGDYTFVWSTAGETEMLVAGFYLRVLEAPTEMTGYNIAGFADRLSPEFQRARLFIKRGVADNTFRLGLTASDSTVNVEEGNVQFTEFDLSLGDDHLVFISWNSETLTARLHLNTEFFSEADLTMEGATNRELRRFAFRTNSQVGIGRYEIGTLRVADDWQTAVLAMRSGIASGFYDDGMLGTHFRAQGGWVLWADPSDSVNRGVLWLGNRSADGTGWVHHQRTGWMHLSGGSVHAGLFAWSVELGWIYTGGLVDPQFFYRYQDDSLHRWGP